MGWESAVYDKWLLFDSVYCSMRTRADVLPAMQLTREGALEEAWNEAWSEAWSEALQCWSSFVKLRSPVFYRTSREAAAAGLINSFASINLTQQSVHINLEEVEASGLGRFAVEILAHEIGHHVLAPATFSDHLRCLARVRTALPTLERHAPMVANLYTDLLINDRLQRSENLRMADVFRALHVTERSMLDSEPSWGQRLFGRRAPVPPLQSRVWTLYLRIMELLWACPKGDLGSGPTDDRLEGDAWLGSRLVRVYAKEWLTGSSRFACLVMPYLVEDDSALDVAQRFADTQRLGDGSGSAVVFVEADEAPLHPAGDPRLDESEGDLAHDDRSRAGGLSTGLRMRNTGQHRPPFEFGALLRSAGLEVDDHEAAIRYYRALAQPHLVPFPQRRQPTSTDLLPEGVEGWTFGEPLDEVDWFESIMRSPLVVAGVTTMKRVWGTSEGVEAEFEPVDLDIYIDSSGSMPNPQTHLSYPALAGAVICLSALRVGASVQATLWSSPGEVLTTGGFVRNPTQILRVLTGYFGGSTQFPLHVLRQTYASPAPRRRAVHLLQVSDLGIDTMWLDEDTPEMPNGWSARQAIARAGGGGTLALELPAGWADYDREDVAIIKQLRDEEGWDLYPMTSLEDLLAFAKSFARRHYQPSDHQKGKRG
jgi:hypothetical protein